MKLSTLLSQRSELMRQLRRANLAYAFHTLRQFAARVHRAGLVGSVTLTPPDPTAERYCATLTALDHNQSVIEEHFTDDDFMLLADVVAFATGHPGFEVTFRIEDIEEDFIAPLRAELRRAGVTIDRVAPPIEKHSEQNQAGL